MRIALSSNDQVLVSGKGEIKCIEMITFYGFRKGYIEKRNANWAQITDHPCRILIIWYSGSAKTNSLFNLISQ